MNAEEIKSRYADALERGDFEAVEEALRLMYESGDPQFNTYLANTNSEAMHRLRRETLEQDLTEASLKSLGGVIPLDDGLTFADYGKHVEPYEEDDDE